MWGVEHVRTGWYLFRDGWYMSTRSRTTHSAGLDVLQEKKFRSDAVATCLCWILERIQVDDSDHRFAVFGKAVIAALGESSCYYTTPFTFAMSNQYCLWQWYCQHVGTQTEPMPAIRCTNPWRSVQIRSIRRQKRMTPPVRPINHVLSVEKIIYNFRQIIN
jgi:hypothetical protein